MIENSVDLILHEHSLDVNFTLHIHPKEITSCGSLKMAQG